MDKIIEQINTVPNTNSECTCDLEVQNIISDEKSSIHLVQPDFNAQFQILAEINEKLVIIAEKDNFLAAMNTWSSYLSGSPIFEINFVDDEARGIPIKHNPTGIYIFQFPDHRYDVQQYQGWANGEPHFSRKFGSYANFGEALERFYEEVESAYNTLLAFQVFKAEEVTVDTGDRTE